ncbi:MAG: fibronectin type III domain-containing protein, partial [Candidatus Fermentibacteria bacterium]
LHNIDDTNRGVAKLSWYAPINNGGYDIIRYHIYRAEGEGEFSRIDSTNHLKRSCIDEDVAQDVLYGYYLTAENELGESEPSQIQPFIQPIVYDPPPAPEIYLTTKGILYIHIHWRIEEFDSLPITEFIVYRNWSEGGQDHGEAYNITPDQMSYNDSNIQFDINYTYQVTAVNLAGESLRSNLIDIRVRNLTKPPPNTTTTTKKGLNLALIYGLIGTAIILIAAGVIYFVMTKQSGFEPPPEEFEMEPDPLVSSVTRNDRGGH